VHHVQTDADVRPEWFERANVVGLTAGTSTPDDVIDRVEARIRLCADASAGHVRRVEAQTEAMPRSVATVAEPHR
jgi:4-hydroxy-3-methylbut-2-enyl diphosphate reductase IspH